MTDPNIADGTAPDATATAPDHESAADHAPDHAPLPQPADRRPEGRPVERRPAIERIGLAIIAVVVMAIFGAIAAASFASGEPFLALMAALGALMTAWAGGMAVIRG